MPSRGRVWSVRACHVLGQLGAVPRTSASELAGHEESRTLRDAPAQGSMVSSTASNLKRPRPNLTSKGHNRIAALSSQPPVKPSSARRAPRYLTPPIRHTFRADCDLPRLRGWSRELPMARTQGTAMRSSGIALARARGGASDPACEHPLRRPAPCVPKLDLPLKS